MNVDKKYNCLIVSSDEKTVPINFNLRQCKYETIKDERDALNEIKMKEIDILIIKGPFEYMEDDELFSIVKDRGNEKEMMIVQIKEKRDGNFEIRRVMNGEDKYILSFFTKRNIDLKELLII